MVRAGGAVLRARGRGANRGMFIMKTGGERRSQRRSQAALDTDGLRDLAESAQVTSSAFFLCLSES